MLTIGIGIDTYKLPVFEKRLTDAGYSFEKVKMSENSLLLRIQAENVDEVRALIEDINKEATRKRHN